MQYYDGLSSESCAAKNAAVEAKAVVAVGGSRVMFNDETARIAATYLR